VCPPGCPAFALTDRDAQENQPSQAPRPDHSGFFFARFDDQAAIASSAGTAGSVTTTAFRGRLSSL
jgi:hypothetical protein